MDILVGQLICLFSIFLTMGTFVLLPVWLWSYFQSSLSGTAYPRVISLCSCFSAGVFVATFFVGLLPEVRNLFLHILLEKDFNTTFPVTEVIVFLGFFLSLLVEQLVIVIQDQKNTKQITEFVDIDNHSEQGHHHGHSHSDHAKSVLGTSFGLRFIFLAFSLGIHSLFEGMALGLQTDLMLLFNLFIGIIIHEDLIALSVGVSLARMKQQWSTTIKFSLLFSSLIPIGQVIGLLIGHIHGETGETISAVLQAIAAGTFVHITFLEIIPEEFQNSSDRLLKVLFLGIGFLVILISTTLF